MRRIARVAQAAVTGIAFVYILFGVIGTYDYLTSRATAQPTPGGPPAIQVVQPTASAGVAAHGQITVTTSATQIKAATPTRTAIVVVNHGSTNVFIGFFSGVTTGNGVLLVGIPGQTLTFQTQSAVFAIVASGSQTVSFYEENR
jgi:hypothetical protein